MSCNGVYQDKTIMITGGAGFIGSHLVDELIGQRVKKVYVIDNLTRGSVQNLEHLDHEKVGLSVYNLTIGKDRIPDDLWADTDVVFHLAAHRIPWVRENQAQAIQEMAIGGLGIIRKCADLDIPLVFASSASVYGDPDYDLPITESHDLKCCNTLYGGLKFLLETMAKECRTRYQGFRFFNVYGPRMDAHGKFTEIFPKWFNLIKDGQPIEVNTRAHLDLVYVKDVVQALLMAAKLPIGIFNVCSGRYPSGLHEVARMLIEEMHEYRYGKKASQEYVDVSIQPSRIKRKQLRWGRISKPLSRVWRPRFSLQRGIKDFVSYMYSKQGVRPWADQTS